MLGLGFREGARERGSEQNEKVSERESRPHKVTQTPKAPKLNQASTLTQLKSSLNALANILAHTPKHAHVQFQAKHATKQRTKLGSNKPNIAHSTRHAPRADE